MPRITGGCLCGAVRYSIDGEPISRPPVSLPLCGLPETHRHGFRFGHRVPGRQCRGHRANDNFYNAGGAEWASSTNCRFCNRCGSPIIIDKDGTGRKLIMAGTLDDKSLFKPKTSLFCEQAPSWVVMPADTENLPRYYT